MNRVQFLALVLTAAIAAAVALSSPSVPLPGTFGRVTTNTYKQPLGNVTALDVTLRMGAGTLRLTTADSPDAYAATITHNAGIRVNVDYAGGRLRITDRGPRLLFGTSATNNWTVQLTRRVPVRLVISTGAGQQTLDLTGLTGSVDISAGAGEVSVTFQEGPAALDRLVLRGGAGRLEAVGLANARARRIEVSGGISEVSLDFSGTGGQTTDVDVRSGAGRVLLLIPSGVGARIQARRAVGRLTLPGFVQKGPDDYENDAWATASTRLDIRASLGAGELEIRGR